MTKNWNSCLGILKSGLVLALMEGIRKKVMNIMVVRKLEAALLTAQVSKGVFQRLYKTTVARDLEKA